MLLLLPYFCSHLVTFPSHLDFFFHLYWRLLYVSNVLFTFVMAISLLLAKLWLFQIMPYIYNWVHNFIPKGRYIYDYKKCIMYFRECHLKNIHAVVSDIYLLQQPNNQPRYWGNSNNYPQHLILRSIVTLLGSYACSYSLLAHITAHDIVCLP